MTTAILYAGIGYFLYSKEKQGSNYIRNAHKISVPDHVAQLVTCPTAGPGVAYFGGD